MQPANAPSPIEELFGRGLLVVEPNVVLKNKEDLSIAYTPGVGHVCSEIVKEPDLFYTTTIAETTMLLLSSGTGPGQCGPVDNPSFMLPELEAVSYSYKAFANVNAFPLVFRQNLVADGESLAWMVEHISPAVTAVELYEVCPKLVEAATEKLGKLERVVVLPATRQVLLNAFCDRPDRRYLSNLVLSVAIRVSSKLHTWGILPVASIQKIATSILEKKILETAVSEFELKEAVLQVVREHLDTKKQLPEDKCAFDLQINFLCPRVQEEIFYHEFQPKNYNSDAVFIHEMLRGMIRLAPNVVISDLRGFLADPNWEWIREVGRKIRKSPELESVLTMKRNFCAIITNGTAILGLGDIGPRAGAPVMEGKICLFRQLGGINVMPLCVSTKKAEDLIRLVRMVADSWNAINLEDIAAPACFVVEEALNKAVDYPVFHDDQHGTAIACLAALINSLRVVKKLPQETKILVNGAGAAGKSITDLLIYYGFKDIIVCDTKGAIYEGREDLEQNEFKKQLAAETNREKIKGKLAEAIQGRDVFVGVSVAKVLTEEMVRTMAKDPIIFALANPEPEIHPQLAKNAGAKIVATGRSDFPNQINNSIVFPGIFRGIVDGKIKKITMNMKKAAAIALSKSMGDNELGVESILPYSLDPKCGRIIATSIRGVAEAEGVTAPTPKL